MERSMNQLSLSTSSESVLLEQTRGSEDNARFDTIEIMREQIDVVIAWLKEAKAETEDDAGDEHDEFSQLAPTSSK